MKWVKAEEKYKSDQDIAAEFENFRIENIEFRPSGKSGWIEIFFPKAGDSVGGGTSYVVDSFIVYDSGKIGFDNWYPENVYFKLVDSIKNKMKI